MGVADLRAFAQQVREGHAAPARIGCASSHVAHFLAACIRDLIDADPHTPLPVLVPITTGSAVEALSSGAVDLLVEPRRKRIGTNAAMLYPMHFVAVGPATEHADNGELDLAALDGVPIATMPPDSLTHRTLVDAARVRRTSLRIVYETRDSRALVSLAREKVCTAVLHSEMLDTRTDPPAAHLASRRRRLSSLLWVEWHREDALSPSALALREVMLRRAKHERETH